MAKKEEIRFSIALIICALLIVLISSSITWCICEAKVRSNEKSTDMLELYEREYERTYACEIKQTDYSQLKNNTFTWLCEHYTGETYLITFELRHTGFMTYAWVEVEKDGN